MSVTINTGDVIAGLAFLMSAYATWRTILFNERQKALIESQEKLNNLLLKKEKNEEVSNMKADLGASFIKLGSNKYRLKLWNKGNATARNVYIEFPDGNDVIMKSDIEEKFPLESLEKYQSVEVNASVCFNTKRKHTINIVWDDSSKKHNEKLVYPTL